MLKNLSTKALYAKLQTFLPKITSWDVPFTAQEERARVQFMTQGEGFETLQSVEPFLAKIVPAKKSIRWADELAPPAALAPLSVLAALPELAALEPAAPALAAPALAALEPEFQVVAKKPKAQVVQTSNPAGIRTVVARNLPRDIKDAEVRALFSAHAASGLRDVYIPRNTDRSSQYFGTLKGFALVKFHTVVDATRAYEALKTLCIRGKNVALEFAKEDR